ncbi:hypothetical protein ACIGHB_31175 [Streptomyces sp. NPDC085460]|uniref:hypothetical protein n=1 Tax=Streptomyces sp. NPDC085460 TaxID=3365723 RepID=UPI0037D1817C
MDIASELPAVVISRLLGFERSTGDNWTRESQGYGAEYTADIIRRWTVAFSPGSKASSMSMRT